MTDFSRLEAKELGVKRLAKPITSGPVISFFNNGKPIGSAVLDNPKLASLLASMSNELKVRSQENAFLSRKLQEAHKALKERPDEEPVSQQLQDRYDQLLVERDQLKAQLSQANRKIEELETGKEVEEEHYEVMKDFVDSAKEAQAFKKYSLRRTVTLLEAMKSEIRETDVMSGWDVIKYLDKCSRQVRAEAAAGRF